MPRSKFLTAATALDFVNQIIFSFVDHFLFDERKHQRTIYILEGGGLLQGLLFMDVQQNTINLNKGIN